MPTQTERSPYSVHVEGLIDSDSDSVDGEALRAELQRVLDPYGLTVRVLGGLAISDEVVD